VVLLQKQFLKELVVLFAHVLEQFYHRAGVVIAVVVFVETGIEVRKNRTQNVHETLFNDYLKLFVVAPIVYFDHALLRLARFLDQHVQKNVQNLRFVNVLFRRQHENQILAKNCAKRALDPAVFQIENRLVR
jgi:hypothetical protein